MAETNLWNDETIPAQKKYFKWYSRLPLICSGVLLLLFFIWGVVDPCVFVKSSLYGVMRLRSGFYCWLIWMLIGAVFSICVFLISKVVQSQKILTVLYLQYLSENGGATEKATVEEATANSIEAKDGEQDELNTLKQLFEAGAISEEEYEDKKKEILGL